MLDIQTNRSFYAGYLRGSGIEIGALGAPLEVLADRAQVRHVDCLATEDLRRAFPGVDGIVAVDVVATADELAAIEDGSLDFIVANHVVEHLVNPLRTLETWRRKLRPGGILYLAFPSALQCPDKVRPLTTLEHLAQEYRAGTRRTPDEHLLAFVFAWNPGFFPDPAGIERLLEHLWARGLVDLDDEACSLLGGNREAVERLLRDHRDDNVHQHVFSYDSMKALLRYAHDRLGIAFRLIDVSLSKACLSESVVLLEATEPGAASGEFVTDRAEVAERIERFLEGWIAEKDRLLEQARAAAAGRLGGGERLAFRIREALRRQLSPASRARLGRLVRAWHGEEVGWLARGEAGPSPREGARAPRRKGESE